MPAPDRAEILGGVKEAVHEYGRRHVVLLDNRDQPHYGFPDELQRVLVIEEEAAGIVKAAAEAVAAYDPQREAVVIDERAEGIFVVIGGPAETRVFSELFGTKRH